VNRGSKGGEKRMVDRLHAHLPIGRPMIMQEIFRQASKGIRPPMIYARHGRAARKETTNAPEPNGQKSNDIKGLARAKTALLPRRATMVRFCKSGLGVGETANDGLPEAEANFRDLHHRRIAIF
jgi:hypothetical protein